MLASSGDHRLGGKDWDDVLVNWVAAEFDKAYGDNPLLDLLAYQDLYSLALVAKIQLSSRDRTPLVFSFNGHSLKLEITRAEYETRCRPLIERCEALCEIALKDAGLSWRQIGRVLLTGGDDPDAFGARDDRGFDTGSFGRGPQPG